MIDEKKELEQYTCKICPDMPRRLTYLNLTNKLAGVKRALVVIARGLLFDRKLDPEQTVSVLNAWCGFGTAIPDEVTDKDRAFFDRISDWLPGYIDMMKQEAGDEAKRNELIKTAELLASKKEAWNYDPFFNDGKKHDKNAVTFSAIVAEAENEGPLKKLVLTFAKPPFEALVLPKKGAQGGRKKLFVMSVAAYCAKAKPGKRKIHLDQPAFSNWIGEGCPNGKKVKEMLEGLSFKCGEVEEKLFSFENAGNETVNYYKMMLSSAFAEEYHPELMTAEEYFALPSEERKRLYAYTDMGCNVIMQEAKNR